MTLLTRRALFAVPALLGLFAASFVGAGLAATDSSTADHVTIDNFTFTPQLLTVKAGTTVTWTNHDDIPHTVLSENRKVKSGALDTDDTFTFKFDAPGTYAYFCSVHPKMTGTVVVTP